MTIVFQLSHPDTSTLLHEEHVYSTSETSQMECDHPGNVIGTLSGSCHDWNIVEIPTVQEQMIKPEVMAKWRMTVWLSVMK